MSALDYCVIFNPAAGRGRARGRLDQWRHVLGDHAQFRPTEQAGHAEELAREAVADGFGVVVAAGGDGTFHEVANGILRAGSPQTRFGVLPIGSANDYAYSLRLERAHRLQQGDNVHDLPADVGLVRGADGRQRYFINGLGLGFNGAVTLEARRIRRLQGLALYGLAFVRALLFRYACPVMEVRLDGLGRTTPTFALTVALGHREGNFVVAPDARLTDGLFNYIHVGPMSRLRVLRYMPRLARGRPLPADDPQMWQGHCREVQVRSATPLVAHADGEFFCRPEEGLRGLEMRMMPGALRVDTRFLDPPSPALGATRP
jgi:diacylglycerol kinase family enzyme